MNSTRAIYSLVELPNVRRLWAYWRKLLFTLLPRRLIPKNSEGYKARKGPGCREPRRKGMLGFVPIGMPLAQPTTVTMTPNNKAVKGYSGLPFPFTEMPRRNVLVYSVSGKYYSRKLRELEDMKRAGL